MTVREFKEYLECNGIPDSAEIVVWADHAQNYERVNDVWVTKNDDGDYAGRIWEFDGYEDVYDDDCIEDYPVDGPVVAICIEGIE